MPPSPLETAVDSRPQGIVPQPQLLATKLHAPAPRASQVQRERLLRRLDSGGGFALALVSAPAGFGKSTLVSDWLRRKERPSAWLSLDPGDSDLRRFLAYLVAALDRPLPGVGRGLAAALAAPRLPDPEPLLTPLLNELWESSGCILVLDDYHVIEAPEVHEALGFFLERLPPEVSLVMATRADPPLHLPRLRARGLLCELRAEDLRFTSEEAVLFLRDTMGLHVSPREVEALERRTEGWIAGLQMAALSLRGRDDVSAFIAGFTGSHRFVLDYLTEEVLDRQPAERMDFLLRTSILPRLSGDLCDAVTGRADGQTVLESLETANLFLIPLDETRGWYRYHHLFANLLQTELRRRISAGELEALHRTASDWFASHGLADEAMNHALAARDWERAAAILEAHADHAFQRGEVGTVARWFAALPEETCRAHPRLLLTRAIMLFASFRFPEFAAVVRDMERAAEETGDPVLAAGLDAMQALALAGQTDYPGTIASATRALERIPPELTSLTGLVQLLLGMSLGRMSQTRRAMEALEQAAAINIGAGNLTLAVVSRANQGLIETLHGRLERARERYRQTLDLFIPFGDTPLPAAGQAYDGLAEIHLEQGELDQAWELSAIGSRLSRSGEVAGHQVRGFATACRILLSRGDFAAAREMADSLVALMSRTREPAWDRVTRAFLAYVDIWEARQTGRPDLLAGVARWAEENDLFSGWDGLRERCLPDYPHDSAHLTVARLLLLTGRLGEALTLLAALRRQAEGEEWVRSQIEIALLESLVRQAQGETAAALDALGRALLLAEPEGFVQLFVDEGAPLARLLASYGAANPAVLATPFGLRLRRALGLAGDFTPAPPPPPSLPGDEPLSDRELEVLRMIARGLSNSEAARRLYLSPHTVKKHLENIYGKLAVRNRTEAIAKLQGMGAL